MNLLGFFGQKKSTKEVVVHHMKVRLAENLEDAKRRPSLSTIVRYQSERQAGMVAKSRDLVMNNEYGRNYLAVVVRNVVGEQGIQLQSTPYNSDGSVDKRSAGLIEAEWKKFADECSLDGEQNLWELQKEAVTSLCADGEFFVRLHYDDKPKHGFQLSFVDSQRCQARNTRQYEADDGTVERNGIIIDKRTKRRLFYLFGDENSIDYYSSTTDLEKVPASEVLHGFIKERTGQLRGLPMLHASQNRLAKLDSYEGYALETARVGASKAALLKPDESSNVSPEEEIEKIKSHMPPGHMGILPPGWELVDWQSSYPNNEFDPFTKAMLRGVAVGAGVSYELLSGDLAQASYASSRMGEVYQREEWRMLQKLLTTRFMSKVYRLWLPLQIHNGNLALPMRELDKWLTVRWVGRKWEWVDPRADSMARINSLRSMITSASEIIRERGGDPQEVFMQIAQDIRDMVDAGVPKEIIYSFYAESLGKTVGLEREPEGDENETG